MPNLQAEASTMAKGAVNDVKMELPEQPQMDGRAQEM